MEGNSPANIMRFIVTPHCNLRCFYCHNEGFSKSESFSPLPLKDAEKILLLLKKKGVLGVCLTGGEPLCYGGFNDVLDIVTKIYGGDNTHISTNGIFLSEHLDFIAEKNIKRLNISCDAIDEFTYSQITGGENVFKKVIMNIQRAISKEIFVNVNCILLKGINTDPKYINSMLEFWKNMGVRLSFLRLCFSKNIMDEYKYNMEDLICLLDSYNLRSSLLTHRDRPPTLCYQYGDMEVSLRYYVPNRSTFPCIECSKRSVCSEGLYHPRLGLNGKLRACVIRDDVSLDLRNAQSSEDSLTAFFDLFKTLPDSWVPATGDSP